MTRPQLYVPRLSEKEHAALFGSAACSCYAARPNNAINSGRIVASLVEWHLVGIAQPLAITMNEGVCLAVEVDPHHIERRLETGYCDEMASTLDEALDQVREARNTGQPLSIGLIGNAAEVYPELAWRGIIPDIVTGYSRTLPGGCRAETLDHAGPPENTFPGATGAYLLVRLRRARQSRAGI